MMQSGNAHHTYLPVHPISSTEPVIEEDSIRTQNARRLGTRIIEMWPSGPGNSLGDTLDIKRRPGPFSNAAGAQRVGSDTSSLSSMLCQYESAVRPADFTTEYENRFTVGHPRTLPSYIPVRSDQSHSDIDVAMNSPAATRPHLPPLGCQINLTP